MESFNHLVQVPHVLSRRHLFDILLVSLLSEDLKGSFPQYVFAVVRERSIASLDKIMVEGSVGVRWRTDCHIGEVQIVDGVGGDRGGDGFLLPLLVGLANQDSGPYEPKADDKEPKNFC